MDDVTLGLHEAVLRRPRPRDLFRDAERDELAHAVLDVEPHPPERLHKRFDVERLVGPRAQEAQDRRAQRRLHQRLELRRDLARIAAGEKVEVKATEGLVLLVEPYHGDN